MENGSKFIFRKLLKWIKLHFEHVKREYPEKVTSHKWIKVNFACIWYAAYPTRETVFFTYLTGSTFIRHESYPFVIMWAIFYYMSHIIWPDCRICDDSFSRYSQLEIRYNEMIINSLVNIHVETWLRNTFKDRCAIIER